MSTTKAKAKRNTRAIDYGRKIILSPKGAARREVTLAEVSIPDLWHVARAAGLAIDLASAFARGLIDDARFEGQEWDETRAEDGDYVDTFIRDRMRRSGGKYVNAEGKTRGEEVEAAIIETWHLAHDLKVNLAGDTGRTA